MTNPFLSTPEATAFGREQRQACEEARDVLIQTPDFAAFLASGGGVAVVPDGFPASANFVALLKDGDTVYAGIRFFCRGITASFSGLDSGDIERLTAWLTEARDGAKPVRPEIEAGDIVSGRIFICEDGAAFTASAVSGDVVHCPELGVTLLREDFAQAMNDGCATF